MRIYAPKNTGKLADSISSEIWETGFETGPTVWYAERAAGGTLPSLGRYVPDPQYAAALGYERGFRLRVLSPQPGVHPGTPSDPFLDIAYGDLQLAIDNMLEEWLDNNVGGEIVA